MVRCYKCIRYLDTDKDNYHKVSLMRYCEDTGVKEYVTTVVICDECNKEGRLITGVI